METKQYKEEFLAEAAEHLDALNEALLLLEKDPLDEETINKIFRSFHTLKGNAGLMGYQAFSELAHALEDLLSTIRNGKLTATRPIIDVMLEGVDTLEQGLASIKEGEPERIDASHLLEELREKTTKKEEQTTSIPADTKLSPEEQRRISESAQEGVRAILFFDQKSPLKIAKSMLLIRDLTEKGELVRCQPTLEQIKEGDMGSELELILLPQDRAATEQALSGIYGVKEVMMMALSETYTKPETRSIEEKEEAKSQIIQKHHAEVIKQVQSVRVDMARLDKLMNLAGELLISNIRLQDINKKGEETGLEGISKEIDRLILELQDQVMKIRLVPIGNIFNRFPRMVRDLAAKEGKEVSLEIKGSEIEFDRTVLDQIGEPLVHMIRNGVDHGIETAAEREAAGKEKKGSIILDVSREKSQAVITVKDDGQGIDHEKVKKKCVAKGLISTEEAEKMTPDQARMLIFHPGVSTNEVVTDVSGRGVGMDVVINKVKELGGTVQLDSKLGIGTSITIRLPLTVAILSALLVKSSKNMYAVPLALIDQIVDIRPEQIKTIQGNQVFLHRGNEVPLFWLNALLGKGCVEKKASTVLIANKDGAQVGLAVDTIVTQQQILIKSLQEYVKGTRGVSGATILGDGSVVLIIDINTLI
jgi:two-component system chemotaxis sensor kinase CheA